MPDLADLLLLPGLLCDAALWEAQVAGLEGLARCQVAEVTADDSLPAMAARALAAAPPRSPWPGSPWAATSPSRCSARRPAGSPGWRCSTPPPGRTRRSRPAAAAG
ncbi:hypothetical protein ACFQY5_30270 [Paeniroseomonas aquatica]|uniref:hypothetical protein n=1 Tax=Paeniroseomonas aquatica TaxID=373043 RepID=UPI0036086EE4